MKLFSRLVMIVLLIGTILVKAPTPTYAVTCSGSGCTGLDAHATGCNEGSIALPQTLFLNGIVRLHYSPTCQTYWAKVVAQPQGEKFFLKAYIEHAGFGTFSLTAPMELRGNLRSTMYFYPVAPGIMQVLRACGFVSKQFNSTVGTGACSNYY
ncbi:MAG: YjfA family protein [Chloroflexi bacterium]|nr:YjfA family protein [Chloroflexota bacterium]